MEKTSIDEAFVDLTSLVGEHMNRLAAISSRSHRDEAINANDGVDGDEFDVTLPLSFRDTCIAGGTNAGIFSLEDIWCILIIWV